MKRGLGWWVKALLSASIIGCTFAIAFKKSDALVLVWLVYASGAAFLASMFLILVAVGRWPRSGN